jgi:hypothetical protein
MDVTASPERVEIVLKDGPADSSKICLDGKPSEEKATARAYTFGRDRQGTSASVAGSRQMPPEGRRRSEMRRACSCVYEPTRVRSSFSTYPPVPRSSPRSLAKDRT